MKFTIETGIDGLEQESSWQNGTLQGNYETTEFTVHTYIDVPSDVLAGGEEMAAEFISGVLSTFHDDPRVRLEVRIGRGGGNL